MNIFKLCFLICKYNFSPVFSMINKTFKKLESENSLCWVISALPLFNYLAPPKIAWLLNFNQGYIKIFINNILSFQMTKKHTQIHGLKYYLPKILKWTACLWQLSLENKKQVPGVYLFSIPALPRESSPGSGMPGHTPAFFRMKNLLVIRQQVFSDKRIEGVAQACQWSHNFSQLLKSIYSDKKAE